MANCLSKCRHFVFDKKKNIWWCNLLKRTVERYISIHRSPDGCKYEKKKNKYRNQITEIDGIKFRSKKEANRYGELKLLKQSGEVSNFYMQKPYNVTEKQKYYLDFLVEWKDGSVTHEDTKGVRTQLYKIKKQLMKEKFGIEIVEL